MARKRGKTKTSRSRSSRSRSRTTRRGRRNVEAARVSRPNSVRIVFNNLILFAILFLISLILYQVFLSGIFADPSGVFLNLFGIFMIAFGFISVAFLITLIVFLVLRAFKKKR